MSSAFRKPVVMRHYRQPWQCAVVRSDGCNQIKLLDTLQENSDRNRAHGDPVPGQVRVIASTAGDLKTAVVEDRIDARLYHYLNFFRIDIPPLRHRQEDLRGLAEHFLAAAVSDFRPAQRIPGVFRRRRGRVCCDSTGRATSCNWQQ